MNDQDKLIYDAWRDSESYQVPVTEEGQELADRRYRSFSTGWKYAKFHSEHGTVYMKDYIDVDELIQDALVKEMTKTVLVVDDSTFSLDLIRKTLAAASFNVVAIENSLDALNDIRGGLTPDVVIVDVNLTGIDFIRSVRTILLSTPIVVLALRNQSDQHVLEKQAGATAWLIKPFADSDLLTVINEVIE